MFTGPNINTDGLVLMLDAGNNKSFRGEPTTNLTTNTPSQNGWGGTYTVVDSDSKTFTIKTQQNNATVTSAWRTWYWSVSDYVGSTVTISADVEFVEESNATFRDITIGQGNTGTYPYHIAGSNSADKVTVSTKPTQKISMTWSGVINATGIVGFTQWINNVTANGGYSTLKITNVQIEVKPSKTRFVNGTRGTTVATGGGWKDISGNSNDFSVINGTTTDSDNTSTGGLKYDGINDYSSKTRKQYSITEPWAIEVVFKPTTATQYWSHLFGGSLGQGGYWMFHNNQLTYYEGSNAEAGTRIKYTGWSYTNTFIVNNFHHLVISYSPINSSSGTYNLYYNGNQKTQTFDITFFWSHSLDSRYLGGNAAETRYGTFIIASFKEYNKALTASEVLQNYNSTKSRFGL